MISFFIDTSLSYIRLALLKDNEIIDFVNEYCEKNLSSLFATRVKNLFKKNKLAFNDIDKIFAVTGPGSFTGIRIGLTFAKILGMSLKKDIIPISELEVLSSTNIDSKFSVPLIDARRGFVYTAMYDNQLNNIVSDKYIDLKSFCELLDRDVTFISYDEFDNLKVKKPSIDFAKIVEKFNNRAGVNYNILTPNYLKTTEAEENLRKKQLNDN